MAPKATYIIKTLLILLTTVTSISAVDITDFLKKYPDFKIYNELLSKTKVADKINKQSTITILLLDNAAIGPITGAPLNMLTTMLETHVLLDYYDNLKLNQLEGQSENVTNLFQNSGQAQGDQGLTHITTTKGDETIFSSAVKGAPKDSKLVRVIDAEPYSFSAIQINKPIVTPGNDMPQGVLSSPIDNPITSPSPIIGSIMAPIPSAMKGFDIAPTPFSIVGNIMAPIPSAMNTAPTPSPIIGNIMTPTPSPMIRNIMAPTPSPIIGNIMAPTPSPMIRNIMAPTPSPIIGNIMAPIPSAMNMAPTPSAMVGNTKAPTPSAMMGNAKAPTPSSVMGNGNAPGPANDINSPNTGAPKPANGVGGGGGGGGGPSSDSESGAQGSESVQGVADEGNDTEAPAKNISNDSSAKLTTLGGAIFSALIGLVALTH